MPGPFFFSLSRSEVKILNLLNTKTEPYTIPELRKTCQTSRPYGYFYYRLARLSFFGLVRGIESIEVVDSRPLKTVQWEITPEGRNFIQS